MLLAMRRLLAAVLLIVTSHAALAGPLKLTAQGLSSLTQPFIVALDFVGTGANQASVGSFQSDGSLTLAGTSGSVQGSLAAGLDFLGQVFLSEAQIRVTGADTFSMVFETTSNAPAGGGFPDGFSIVFLDALSGLPLLDTSDPTGAGSLFLFSIDGSSAGALDLYQPNQGGVSWTVQPVNPGPGSLPEPSSALLVVLALGALAAAAARRRLAWAGLALLLSFGARADDITSSVEITRGGLVLNRVTNTFDAQVTVKNTSGSALLGPLKLALADVAPADVALYNTRGRLASGAEYVLLPLAKGTLDPGASVAATVRLLAGKGGVTSTVFALDGQRLVPGKTATVSVQGVYAAGYQGPVETALPAGYPVRVNGIVRGVTDALGRLDVAVLPGQLQVSIGKPPNEGGSSVASVVAGGTAAVKVAIDDGKEIAADGVLRIDAVQQGVLSRSAPRVAARFQDARDQSVRLALLTDASVQDVSGQLRNLTNVFSVQADGSVAAATSSFLGALSGLGGRLTLNVSGEDAAGNVYKSSASFYLADYRVRVQLVAPPSAPGLSLANVRVQATVLNTTLQFQAQSDATGLVVLPDVPKGNLSLKAVTTAAGLSYTGAGTAALGYDALVSLTLRGPQDVLNNVPPIAVQPLPANLGGLAAALATASKARTASADSRRLALHQSLRSDAGAVRRKIQAAGGPPSVTVSASGGAENAVIEGSASLSVPKGTKKLTLSYVVSTAEYPTYVLQQSIYNDVWSLSVTAPDGSTLFEQTRQINSQLSQDPVWLPNGSTGTLKKEFDVSGLTANAAASFVVRVSSVNIGDDLLATTVNATLDATEPLIITSAVATDSEIVTVNDGSYYSIPRTGATNTTDRTFTVELSKPSGSTLTKASVELLDSSSAQLMAVLTDVAPGAAGVEVLDDQDTSAKLKIRVTIQNPTSTVGGVPPPTRDIGYRLTIKANDAGGNEIKDEKTVSGKRSLWRMPNGLARYGSRDAGGDDWVSRGGYNWLVTNNNLLQAIDDISGEHGTDLGHSSHDRGTDIDFYHFYRFPGATTGTSNYNLLTADVVAAFGTLQPAPVPPAATAALNRVAAWLAATRTGLQSFTNLASVNIVIHCRGVATQGLPAAWCADLIQTGVVTRTVPGSSPAVTQTLNLGGTFTSTKMRWQNDHNNHVHVALNRAQINE